MTQQLEKAPKAESKKEYAKPQLTKHGAVESFTQCVSVVSGPLTYV